MPVLEIADVFEHAQYCKVRLNAAYVRYVMSYMIIFQFNLVRYSIS